MFGLPQKETKLLVIVHGWFGVITGILMFVLVVTGTVVVLAHEIGHWSTGVSDHRTPFDRPVHAIVEKLKTNVGRAYREDVSLGYNAAGNMTAFFHKQMRLTDGRIRDRGTLFEVDPKTGKILFQREGFSNELRFLRAPDALVRFLVDAHVRLYLPHPWGLLLTGVLGLAMLAAAISGLLMHRHLLRDIFTLRTGRSRILDARDRHTVAASWGLPFAFLLALTGAFFSFATSFALPVLAMVAFGGNKQEVLRVVAGQQAYIRPGPRVQGANLDQMIADARKRVGTSPVSVSMEHFTRKKAKITFNHLPRPGELEGKRLIYNGYRGEFVREKPIVGSTPSAGAALASIIGPLHFGNFAGILSKAVWVALGFASSFIVLSGLQLWLRRREDRPGWRWYERAVVVTSHGLPLSLTASAMAFFILRDTAWVNAAPPYGFASCAVAVIALGLFISAQSLSRLLMPVLAASLLSLPVLRYLSGGPGWQTVIESGYVTVMGMDILLIIIGAHVAALSWQARTREETSRLAAASPETGGALSTSPGE